MADIGRSIVTIPGPGRVTLHALADLQYGSKSSDETLMRRKLKDIVDDPTGGMSVVLGDLTDDDRPTTRIMRKAAFAGRPEVLDADARDKKFFVDDKVIPMLLPLASTKHGIIGVLAGHHWSYVRVEDEKGVKYVNSARYICDELGRMTKRKVPYLGIMSAWIQLVIEMKSNHQSVLQMIHIQHGVGGGQTLASALNKLETTARWAEADLLIRAHDCKLVAGKIVRLGPRMQRSGMTRSLKSSTIGLLNIGSMTRGYVIGEEEPDYVEMEMMRPTSMGWGKAHFNIRKSSRVEDPNQNFRADLTCEI
ncbi:MAG: hypothetical protein KGZ65_04415 [Sphingomonadales bacterium]|nr:hypothetical protein [Sphingomonadaceae bacterium]MBS3930458.1 hypothetical protein [Sphingomonadales bacterium]